MPDATAPGGIAPAPAPAGAPPNGRVLLAALAALVLYGSLYPFNFAPPARADVAAFWLDWRIANSIGDVLGNVALFVPWGTVWMWTRAGSATRALLLASTSGLALALLAQVLQLGVPARTAQLSDVVWNGLGIACGLAVAALVPRPTLQGDGERRTAALLLALCLAAAWMPLVPSLDWSLVKLHLKALGQFDARQVQDAAIALVLAGFAAELGNRLARRQPVLVALALVGLMLGGRLLVVGARFNPGVVVGTLLGACAWVLLHSLSRQRSNALAWTFLAACTTGALAPFELRPEPGPLGLLPFASLLRGSMLANASALAGELMTAAAIVYCLHAGGLSIRRGAAVVATWMALLELPQMMLVSRTADLTVPLLVLALGLVMGQARPVASTPVRAPRPGPAPPSRALPARAGSHRPVWLRRGLLVVLPTALITWGLQQMLRLPQIPYNVRELFEGSGAWPALAAFALALLWMGAGPVWAGGRVSVSRWPGALLVALAVACSLVMLGLLELGVTEESIGDVSGSNNLYWFVTEKNLWGSFWSTAFPMIGRPIIDTLERGVRFTALFAPLPVLLMTIVALPRLAGRSAGATVAVVQTLLAGGALMALCKAIAFDWSSTDNLNELIAPDGPWGWGGGGYLYALLVLLLVDAWLLARASLSPARWQRLAAALALTAASLPLGWWLIGQGLNPQVHKYDTTYPALQFLLGPDRRTTMSEAMLLLRWLSLQLTLTLLLAAGMAIALRGACEADARASGGLRA